MQVRRVGVLVSRGEQNLERLSQHLRAVETEDRFRAVIELNDRLVFVDRNDGVRGDLEDARKLRFRRTKLFFGELSASEVPVNGSPDHESARHCGNEQRY